MKYAEFRNQVKKYPVFRSNIFEHLTDKPEVLRRQVSEWLEKGNILQLKRGLYTLKEDDRSVGLSIYLLANLLYSPSYISLETALSYYGFIPERVHAVTSVSSRKTQQFSNTYGYFNYSHVKPPYYGGFINQKDEYGNNFFIASKERAIIDFLYLKMRGLDKIKEDVFDLSYRFQNLDLLDTTILLETAKSFQQKKLMKLVDLLIQYREKQNA